MYILILSENVYMCCVHLYICELHAQIICISIYLEKNLSEFTSKRLTEERLWLQEAFAFRFIYFSIIWFFLQHMLFYPGIKNS